MISVSDGPAPAPAPDTRTPGEILAAKIGVLLEDETLHPETRGLLQAARSSALEPVFPPAGDTQPEGAD